jgi:predicted transcriptional regulator
MMYEGGFRNVPVVESGRPVGLVSARDALGPELKEFVYEMLRQEQTTDVLA